MAWTIGNRYLTGKEMQGNATEVNKYFSTKGWSLNAIAGMLGNMERESNINPGLWQSLNEGNYKGGFGLVQWTPATNYTDWVTRNGYSISDPIGQMRWINELSDSSGQWIKTSAYNITFDEFKKSTQTPEWLASAFLKNFERAGVEVEDERRAAAKKWYNFFGNSIVIENAVKWAVGIANDDSHGYDQAYRDGPDYDCSSLLSWAWYKAGLDTRPGYTPSTSTMYAVFTDAGFIDVTNEVNLSTGSGIIRGDVLLRTGHHTAMSVGGGRIVHARSNEHGGITGGQTGDQTGNEIAITEYYNAPWDKVLRYPGGNAGTIGVYLAKWISG